MFIIGATTIIVSGRSDVVAAEAEQSVAEWRQVDVERRHVADKDRELAVLCMYS